MSEADADFERAAEAERALALLPFHKALPPSRRRRKRKTKSTPDIDIFENMGRLTGDAIRKAVEPLHARIAQLEAGPFKFLGAWTQGMDCNPGNIVSWDGSMWHCNEATKAKPGTGPAFTLCVKRGQNGKDAK